MDAFFGETQLDLVDREKSAKTIKKTRSGVTGCYPPMTCATSLEKAQQPRLNAIAANQNNQPMQCPHSALIPTWFHTRTIEQSTTTATTTSVVCTETVSRAILCGLVQKHRAMTHSSNSFTTTAHNVHIQAQMVEFKCVSCGEPMAFQREQLLDLLRATPTAQEETVVIRFLERLLANVDEHLQHNLLNSPNSLVPISLVERQPAVGTVRLMDKLKYARVF